jgi:hypothetical protein
MYHRSSVAKSSNVISVRLPADLQLDASDFCRMSAVHQDPFDGGYTVDFFDPNDAWRYQQLADKMRSSKAQQRAEEKLSSTVSDSMFAEEMFYPPGLEPMTLSPPGLEHIPTPFKNEFNATKTRRKAPQPKGHEVQIQGLPENLCKEVMIAAMMEQARLEESILNIDTSTCAKQCVACITFDSQSAADKCVEHCHGQKWNPMGPSVVARITSKHDAKSLRGARNITGKPTSKGKPNAQQSVKSSPSWLRADAPAYVYPTLTKDIHDKKMTTNSDASTTVSDSDVDDERRHGSKTAAWLAGK